MGLGALQEHQIVRWRDRLLKLIGRLPDGDWHMTELATGHVDKQSDNTLLRAVAKGELTFVSPEDPSPEEKSKALLQTLSNAAVPGPKANPEDSKQKEAVSRFSYVTAIKDKTKTQALAAMQAIWAKIGWPGKVPGYSSVCSWRAKAEGKSDPIAALADRSKDKGRTGDRYSPEVMGVLRKIRDSRYLKHNPRISIRKATKDAQTAIKLVNKTLPAADKWPIPGRRAMVKVIQEIPAVEVAARRYGPDAAMRMMRTSLGGVKADRPLKRVEYDHTTLAIILLDEDFTLWGRANMTMAVDAHESCPVGFYYGAEVPSIVSIARCTRCAVMPKEELLSNFPNVKGDWPCYGVADTNIYDNGFSEHAPALRQACSELGGTIVEFCPRAAPWFKPHIERHFRTQDVDLLQGLPGATMENILTRSDINPKKDIFLRRSVFDRIFMKWLVDIHIRTPRASLGNRSMIDVWRRDIKLSEQFIPTRTTLLERLFFREEENRRLDHEGIEYDCLIYNSTDMGDLRSQLGAVLKVTIRVSDEDIGFIYVGVPNHDIWIKVPCLDQKYAAGMTRWQHDRCKKLKRAEKDDGVDIGLAEAREEITEEIEREQSELGCARRKKRSRFKEKDPLREGKSVESTTAQDASEAPVAQADPDNALDDSTPDAGGQDSDVPSLEIDELE